MYAHLPHLVNIDDYILVHKEHIKELQARLRRLTEDVFYKVSYPFFNATDTKARMSASDKGIVKRAPKITDLNSQRLKTKESESDPPDPPQTKHVKLSPDSLTTGLVDKCPPGSLPASVKKEVIFGGRPSPTQPPYPNKTKIRFHYTCTDLEDGTVYDDTRSHPKPMEIILGKKFKIEIWEVALNTMVEGEVSKFLVPKELCIYYPMVAKVLRDSIKPKSGACASRSCCGSLLSGTGHSDLDELLKRPRNLSFHFEILDVNLPGSYEMESWYMTDDEKTVSLTQLQEEGNNLFWNRHYKDASAKYVEAISRIEQLMNKEVPGSEEMKALEEKKVPLLLNHGLCQLRTREYYAALRLNNLALEIDKDNVKGHYRRGQCHKMLANFEQARKDLARALELDPTLKKSVNEEFEEMDVLEKGVEEAERIRCQKMFRFRKIGKSKEC